MRRATNCIVLYCIDANLLHQIDAAATRALDALDCSADKPHVHLDDSLARQLPLTQLGAQLGDVP